MNNLDPLGEALFGLQADDDYDAMMSITDIPLNAGPANPSPYGVPQQQTGAGAGGQPGARVSTLAQQWERENQAAKQQSRPIRQQGAAGSKSFLRTAVSAPTLRGDTEMEIDGNLAMEVPQLPPTALSAIKMDLLGRGSDAARSTNRSASSGASEDLAERRRSRSTLPPNFRLTFNPNAAGAGAGPNNILPVAAQALAGAVISNAGAGAGPSSLGGGRGPFSNLSAKESIEEEEEMAMNMSIYGNPFGPRPPDPNSFAWLGGQGGGAAGGGMRDGPMARSARATSS